MTTSFQKISRNALIFVLCVAAVRLCAQDVSGFSSSFRLLPQPQKLELLPGDGLMFSELRAVFLRNAGRPVMDGYLAALPLAHEPGQGVVTLSLLPGLDVPSPEGYVLEVSGGQVRIEAKEEAGLFYGIQTLQQLVSDSFDQQLPIPALRITDYPDIAYRAIHLDLKHHLDASNYYYTMMDKLAGLKINAVIIEFEDKLRYTAYPEVGARHAISREEFAMLSAYAKERNIEISPLVQGLGHASFILKHESMKDLRDDVTSDWVFDPLNPRTYEVQFSLYDDALAATPYGKYLHVGGDEVGDLGKSERSRKSGMTPFDLQMYWLTKVCEYAVAHGRTPIFWDDMVFKLSGLYRTTWDPEIPEKEVVELWSKNRGKLDESIGLFPRSCVYMRWNYSHPHIPGNILALDWYNSHGLKVMAATSAQQIWPMVPRDRSNFQAIKDYSRITAEKKLHGILCTIWDDTSPHFETVWRGIYDFGSMAWNHANISAEEAHTMFRHRHFAPAAAAPDLEIQDLLEDAMPFWDTALLAGGDRHNYHKQFDLIDLPDAARPGKWSGDHRKRLDDARAAIRRYELIRARIEQTQKVVRRNAYTLDVMNAINELHVYPARLLIALGKYDLAKPADRTASAKEVLALVESFDGLRKQVENVYFRTRMPGNPEGYKLDSNLHGHLANGTNNSDWMYVYELPMNRKIREKFVAPK